MDAALKSLLTRLPPPKNAPFREVDWPAVEAELGIQYPEHFKEFVGQYGACIWFDNFSLRYPTESTPDALKQFKERQVNVLEHLKDNMFDSSYKPVAYSLYPDLGGLYPFLEDFASSYYLWHGAKPGAEKPPVVAWLTGPTKEIGKLTIAEMFCLYLDRKSPIIDVWGDVNELPPGRKAVDPR